jgi:beta-galactosidase/beta-glucuronidase
VTARPAVRGKLLSVGGETFYARGVTYGPFAALEPARAAEDFAAMAEAGVNSVRTYTLPPARLLDLAREHGLHVLAGIDWEDHVAFLESRRTARAIEERVRSAAAWWRPSVRVKSSGRSSAWMRS